MAVVTPQENLVRVSTNKGETISLTIDAGAPATLQVAVVNSCSCGDTSRRTGAYTDTDFGTH